MTALLELDAVNVARGEMDTLRDISLHVNAGELVAVLGANGAGKTTLLRTLSGLLRPKSGQIRFSGEPIGGLAPHRIARAGLQQVPEGRGIISEMTVAENLSLGAYMRGAQRVKDTLGRVFSLFPVLERRRMQQAGMLSGGEQQMLAIGRSLLGLPKLLMIDELSLGLAPKTALELMRVLAKLRDEGSTVLIVEQNAQQALKFADRVYVLANGRLVLTGTPAQLTADPKLFSAYLGRD
ncbi:ABC transporter ATP-binding protein [Paucibacter sp. R3-3]|uniref:ABC transporter ATP-binding protein n=1 Tax=Roseateles agri TaxID=3098619 RepID=A0ABU5DP08_9BURK|nr:ABC transporter ATP-binding protein [Paucibacter sp. R3-3]MDY0748043.1 ABC transporter ATP-binding protein [Paucibacter sp. R3-3]